MITVTLYKNKAEKNRLNKTNFLSGAKSYNCWIRDDCSLTNPVIMIETTDNISEYNYLKLSINGKYYFIDAIDVVRTNLWGISTQRVDVLMSYKSEILENEAIIKRNSYRYNLYINDGYAVTQQNERIECLKFPTSLGEPALFLNTVGG